MIPIDLLLVCRSEFVSTDRFSFACNHKFRHQFWKSLKTARERFTRDRTFEVYNSSTPGHGDRVQTRNTSVYPLSSESAVSALILIHSERAAYTERAK